MCSIIDVLQGTYHPVSEWLKLFQLNRHLLSEYKGIVQVIYHFPSNNFAFQIVLDDLLVKKAWLKIFNSADQRTANFKCYVNEVVLHGVDSECNVDKF